jgi:plasmid maintenance system killer protein
VREKLKYLDAAANIGDLRVPPGNQLEALDVEIIDYH